MIEEIYIAANESAAQQGKTEVEVRAGRGIVGDRNFGRNDYPGQQITFIERESIDWFNREYAQSIDPYATRRNVLTRGVRLNELVGKTFSIGNVHFKGVELCEPCSTLGKDLATPSVSAATVVKAFVGKGGLRADVVDDGVIATGMRLEVAD